MTLCISKAHNPSFEEKQARFASIIS